jgi:NTE family protein
VSALVDPGRALARKGPPPASPSIALALGGGAARGLAHIVALEALEELGVRPRVIAGTSIGALCGWACASSMPAKELRRHTVGILSRPLELIGQMRRNRKAGLLSLSQLAPIGKALLNAEMLIQAIAPEGLARSFADLDIALATVATDFDGQCPAVHREGPLVPAVAASMAVPGFFAPVMIDGRPHIDGGLVNPLPFDLLLGAADLTVAIDVSGHSRRIRKVRSGVPSAFDTLLGSFPIIERMLIAEKLRARAPDILIRPNVGSFGPVEFHKVAEILEASASAKEEVKRALAERLDQPRTTARRKRNRGRIAR